MLIVSNGAFTLLNFKNSNAFDLLDQPIGRSCCTPSYMCCPSHMSTNFLCSVTSSKKMLVCLITDLLAFRRGKAHCQSTKFMVAKNASNANLLFQKGIQFYCPSSSITTSPTSVFLKDFSLNENEFETPGLFASLILLFVFQLPPIEGIRFMQVFFRSRTFRLD